jgi:hypothetical protein
MGKRHGSQPQKKSKTPDRPSAPAARAIPVVFSLFIVFTRRYPFLCLTGVWIVMLMLGWVSVRGIIYTDSSPMEAEKTTADVVANKPPQPLFAQPDQTASSVGMLIILALCCAGTTLLLARQLRPVKPVAQRRVLQRTAKGQRPTSGQSQTTVVQPLAGQPIVQPIAQPVAQSMPQPTAQPTPRAAQPVSYQVGRPQTVQVSVVPPDQEAPMDWGEKGLANLMDIRKRSISSF